MTSQLDQQILRVEKRDQLSQADAQARIASQLPIAEKVKRAGYVIPNDATLADLAKEVEKFYEVLRRL